MSSYKQRELLEGGSAKNAEKSELSKEVLVSRIQDYKISLNFLEGDRREDVLKKILEYSTRLVDFVDENEYFEIMRKINKELEDDDNNLMAA
ncbi:MAG TPA: hypothetical protein EYG89_02430 [Bacteroidia bacterium]|nr:hypothetical protein [Bacteroidia bacterium]